MDFLKIAQGFFTGVVDEFASFTADSDFTWACCLAVLAENFLFARIVVTEWTQCLVALGASLQVGHYSQDF